MPQYAVLIVALLTLPVSISQAADATAGKKLVDSHCYACHGTEVYTRADRRINSLPALHSQVRRCELSLGLKWFDDEVENAASYLDKEFYRFK